MAFRKFKELNEQDFFEVDDNTYFKVDDKRGMSLAGIKEFPPDERVKLVRD